MVANSLNRLFRFIPTWLLYILLTLPGFWVFYLAISNQLGADPLKALEHKLGLYALQLLIATLLITPLRNLTGLNLIKFRRAVGLMAFFYAFVHLLVYLWLDQQWVWSVIWEDLTKRPYIIIGMVAFLMMLPLAVTSNTLSIRHMGPVLWKKVHKLVYLIALGGAAHFVILQKTWQIEPVVYLCVIVCLLGYRLLSVKSSASKSG